MTDNTKRLNLKVFVISVKIFFVLFISLTIVFGLHKSIIAGLLLGTTVSLVSFLFLSIYAEAALMRTSSAKIKFGIFANISRFFIIIIAVMTAIWYPKSFNIFAVIVGLITAQTGIILTEAFGRPIIDRQNNNKEGGK